MKSTKDAVDQFLLDKHYFHSFLLRRGYFVPHKKGSAVTIPFMDAVFTGQCFLPKQTEVHPVRLASMPSKKHAKEQLI